MRSWVRTLLAAGLVVLAGVGCSTSVPGQGVSASSAPMASEAEILALKERAAAFWAARVAGDVDAQWRLLEPRWTGRMTAAEYGSDLTGGRYLAYQVEGVAVNGFFATVKVRLLVQQILPPSASGRVRLSPQGTVVEEGWIRIGGVWYRRLGAGGPVPGGVGGDKHVWRWPESLRERPAFFLDTVPPPQLSSGGVHAVSRLTGAVRES